MCLWCMRMYTFVCLCMPVHARFHHWVSFSYTLYFTYLFTYIFLIKLLLTESRAYKLSLTSCLASLRDPPVSASPVLAFLYATVHSFLYECGESALLLAWKALHWLSHIPSPSIFLSSVTIAWLVSVNFIVLKCQPFLLSLINRKIFLFVNEILLPGC